jgi:hypothetical protein
MKNGKLMWRGMALTAAMLFTMLLIHQSPAEASWLVWYPEQRLTNDPSASNLSANGARSVVCDAAGHIHVVWGDYRGGASGIYHKVFDGVIWSADSLISDPSAIAYNPAIAADEAGGVHVVWTDYRDYDAEIYYRGFDGAAWSAEVRLTVSVGSSLDPSIAAGTAGRLHVVWEDSRDGNWEIYHKAFDGVAWSADERLTNNAALSTNASVETDAAGDVYVVWQDSRPGNYEIYLKRFDGISWSSGLRLTTDAGSSVNPTVDVDPAGRWHVVWDDDRGGDPQIYYKFYQGGTWSADTALTVSAGEATGPTIQSDASGNLHLVWEDTRDGDTDIYYKGFHAGIWASDQPLTFTRQEARRPSITVTTEDSVHVVWEDRRHGQAEIYWRWSTGQEVALLVIDSIEPSEAFYDDIVDITRLAGENFLPPAEVWLEKTGEADIPATAVAVVSPQKITCTFDLAGAALGYWDVAMESGDGQTATLPAGFRVKPWDPPVVTSITPSEGFYLETLNITDLAGENFHPGADVRLLKSGEADIVAASVAVVSPEMITCTIYLNGPAGYWDVAVTNADGGSDTLPSAFWVKPWEKPLITSITPSQSSYLETVEITDLAGDNFHPGAQVRLEKAGEPDVIATHVTVVSSTMITCSFYLDCVAGHWDVVVENLDGQADTLVAGFWIKAWEKPVLTSIAPSTGYTGEVIEIADLAGDFFRAGLEVRLEKAGESSIVAEDVVVETPEKATCTFVLSSAAEGLWDVVVENLDGLSDTLPSGFDIRPGIWSGDIRLTNDPGFSSTSKPNAHCIAADREDNLHVVWYDNRDGNNEIYYKKYNGVWGPDERLTSASGSSEYPSMTTDSRGYVHVVWTDHRDGNAEIYYKCHNDSGWRPDERLTDSAQGSLYPSIASDGAGNLHLVWQEYTGSVYEIRYRRHDGAAWGAVQLLASGYYQHRMYPTLAVDEHDSVHVAWSVSDGHIEYKMFDGTSWATTQILTQTNGPGAPAIVAGPEGRLHLIWHATVDTGMGYDVLEVFYKGFDGAAWGPDEKITTDPSNSHNATIAIDDSANVYVVWMDSRAGDTEIYYKVFDGTFWTGESRLTFADRESRFPFCATDGSGKLHVVWSDRRDENFEIYYKVRDPGVLSGLEDPHIARSEADLLSVAPNPVVGGTTISFALGKRLDVGISIYDTAGRLVWESSHDGLEPGIHSIRWNSRDTAGRQVAPGVYFLKVRAGDHRTAAKVVVLR